MQNLSLCLFSEFITGLLNNVGTHIDPTKLIEVRLCTCVFTCIHVQVCICTCVYMHACVCARARVCTCACVYVHACYEYTCTCVSMCYTDYCHPQQIPSQVEIPHLRDSLVKLLQDFSLQVHHIYYHFTHLKCSQLPHLYYYYTLLIVQHNL